MPQPILYANVSSPPARSVKWLSKSIDLQFDYKYVNLLTEEHLTEEFLKLNPQHTIPVLDDNGNVIWDSHAICTYLIDKFSPDHSLYPKDLYTRARIDQRLHFDSGILYPAIRIANYTIYLGASVVPQDKIDALHAALKLLEVFLKDDDYLVGNTSTLADICCLTTVTSYELHFPIDEANYPNIRAWINRSAQLPFYNEFIVEPMVRYRHFIEGLKQTNAAKQQSAAN